MAYTADRYFIINKPKGIVSQFISPDNVGLLGDVSFQFPEGTHAVGRLDRDSEGLLILTTNKRITRLLFSSGKSHQRTYLVMVQNMVTPGTFQQLKDGIQIRIKGGGYYLALPDAIEIVKDPQALCPYAVDEREMHPHTWLLITLSEGKFRQVRKMVLAVRHRCMRLIRISIDELQLGSMAPGEVKELDERSFCISTGISL